MTKIIVHRAGGPLYYSPIKTNNFHLLEINEINIFNVNAALDDQTDEIKVAKLYERLDQLNASLEDL